MHQTASFRRSLAPLAAVTTTSYYYNQGNIGINYPIITKRDWAMGQYITANALRGDLSILSSLHSQHLRLDGQAFVPISSAFAKLIKTIDFAREPLLLLPLKEHEATAQSNPKELLTIPRIDAAAIAHANLATPPVQNVISEPPTAASEMPTASHGSEQDLDTEIAETYDVPGDRGFQLRYAVTVGGEVFWYRPDVQVSKPLNEQQFDEFEALYPNWASPAGELTWLGDWEPAGEDSLFDDAVIDRLAFMMESFEVDLCEGELPEQPREIEEPRVFDEPREEPGRRRTRLYTIVEETEEELFCFMHGQVHAYLNEENKCVVEDDASEKEETIESCTEEPSYDDEEEEDVEEEGIMATRWAKHSYTDENRHINTHLNAYIAEGLTRPPRLSSAILLTRRQEVEECSGPEIRLTTPEVEDFRPQDITYYPQS
ncbi:hypothetical protein B0T25DRAFT_574275 [Lasiosphaeria hispida]|uniref:Uncharacterized protein n=1 Tax=Lasiosphaeria hispida TaxID=260671 RepID=A0AAJ0H7F4_9PEZI|nr:hypothetical protein B0T25DRAFT_574275 [Lasiosphaeria hispida]